MAHKTPPFASASVPVVEHVAPLPTKAPEKAPEPAGPPALDAKHLAVLAKAIDELGKAKETETRLREARDAAAGAHAGASAALDAARKAALEASTALAGGDLADNFIALTDEDARALKARADSARCSVQALARSKLFAV